MCWYCHWGLPKDVFDIYAKYCDLIGDQSLEFGPAHIVWSDNNLDDGSINFCLKECDTNDPQRSLSPEDVKAVRESLLELLAIPQFVRCPPGIGCDDNEYQNHPPPVGMEMVKKR